MSTDGSGRTVAFGHVGLQVADLDRSIGYYRDVIGLRLLERLVRDDGYLKVVVGYPQVTLDIALLVEPASGVLLELLRYRGTDGTPVDAQTANPGTAHVCFEVDDVDAIHARAIAAGHGAVNAPVTPTSGRWTGGRSVYLIDPDGIRVELVQRGPAMPTTATRFAWTARLRPGRVADYVAAHARTWPEVLDAIRAAGIHDYSIWLFEDRVFAQYSVTGDHEAALRIEAAADATQRWRALMRDYFAPEVATDGVTWMPEIFRLD